MDHMHFKLPAPHIFIVNLVADYLHNINTLKTKIFFISQKKSWAPGEKLNTKPYSAL